jgi:CheY-like chemotaxis protein
MAADRRATGSRRRRKGSNNERTWSESASGRRDSRKPAEQVVRDNGITETQRGAAVLDHRARAGGVRAMTSQAGKSILVVDDNRDARTALASLFRLLGFTVGTAADGLAALEYLLVHPLPSLIVLDLLMPRMDGFEFLAARGQDHALSQIPVLVCSSEPEWAVRDALGDAAYLPKGTDPARLIQTVLALCA